MSRGDRLLVLGIETSQRAGSVALVEWTGSGAAPDAAAGSTSPRAAATSPEEPRLSDAGTGRLLGQRLLPADERHGRSLLPAIVELLGEANRELADLSLLAVGTGPGSYTSLRIGLATARSLAYALGKPMIGLSSFDARAAVADLGEARSLVVAEDAYRGEVYVGRYAVGADGGLTRRGEIACCAPAEALRGLARPAAVVGGGPKRHPEAFAADDIDWDPAQAAPTGLEALALAEICAAAFARGYRQDPREALPLYLRPSLPLPGAAGGVAAGGVAARR